MSLIVVPATSSENQNPSEDQRKLDTFYKLVNSKLVKQPGKQSSDGDGKRNSQRSTSARSARFLTSTQALGVQPPSSNFGRPHSLSARSHRISAAPLSTRSRCSKAPDGSTVSRQRHIEENLKATQRRVHSRADEDDAQDPSSPTSAPVATTRQHPWKDPYSCYDTVESATIITRSSWKKMRSAYGPCTKAKWTVPLSPLAKDIGARARSRAHTEEPDDEWGKMCTRDASGRFFNMYKEVQQDTKGGKAPRKATFHVTQTKEQKENGNMTQVPMPPPPKPGPAVPQHTFRAATATACSSNLHDSQSTATRSRADSNTSFATPVARSRGDVRGMNTQKQLSQASYQGPADEPQLLEYYGNGSQAMETADWRDATMWFCTCIERLTSWRRMKAIAESLDMAERGLERCDIRIAKRFEAFGEVQLAMSSSSVPPEEGETKIAAAEYALEEAYKSQAMFANNAVRKMLGHLADIYDRRTRQKQREEERQEREEKARQLESDREAMRIFIV